MTSHVLLPALDPDRPATTSPAVLGLLRQQLGFGGVIITDGLDMAGISGPRAYGSIPAAAVAALAAGADLLCLCSSCDDRLVDDVIAAIRGAVAAGDLAIDRLADAAARVDRLAAGRRTRSTGSAAPAADPAGGDWSGLGRQVAERAIRVDGAVPDLAGALVVRLLTAPLVAAGPVQWGVGPALAGRLAGTTLLDMDERSAGTPLPADRPVLAVVRDAHRHPWVLRWLADTARVSRLTVVEMGWPGTVPLPGECRIWTYGASRVAGEAAADLLAAARAGSGR
jgi:beta-N-acetylhexosaminidase